MNQRSFMNHGLCPIDHKVMMRVAAGSELKMVNSKNLRNPTVKIEY